MSVVIETTLGDITVDLYLKDRPNTCLNFLKLCKIKYYNLCLIHKIERNFIAQTGDPTGTGRGGESVFCQLYGDQAKYFDSEFKPRLKHEKLGTISMVNNGNNMNGSQFFLTLGENLTYLDEAHTVFGEVVEGFDILHKFNEAICDGDNRPYQDIRITHTVVLHDPYEDPKGLQIPDASPEPTKEQLESGYIAADEEIDDTKGKTAEEIEEKIKESEAKARATILEMVGDIPDAEIKPPENVLFVCKLNPVTTSEDLEIIFSRFGTIVSCEVIKDKKTGDSLQYAFIEFEKEEDCENAFFKMDNVLIDDRRIHVDFSQSVSKMYWDKGSKFQNNRVSKQNVVLKSDSKGTDGYELIFDNNPEEVKIQKSKKRRSKTPELRHSYSKKLDSRHKSRSPVSKKKLYDEEKEYHNHKVYIDSKSERNRLDKSFRSKQYISHTKDKNKDYDEQFNASSKFSSRNSSKSYREPEQSKKSSESYSAKHSESSRKRYRQDSVLPEKDKERQKFYDRKRQQRSPSYDHAERYKYSKIDDYEHYRRDKKCKSSHKEAKESRNLYSTHSKKYGEKSYYGSKHQKASRKECRSSSASSSSSSFATAKKRSKRQDTSSSDSDTTSDSSSDGKSNKKYHQHQKKLHSHTSVSQEWRKKSKNSRYNS